MSNKPLHILLVDDDADDRLLFQEAMNEVNPQAKLSTADGCDMLMKLAKIENDKPDMIFLDLNMPGLNGFECLEEIKSKHHFGNIPVIIYSTTANPEQVKKTYTIGATLYMQKPSSFDGIKKLMNQVLKINFNDHRQKAMVTNMVLSAG
ncbi:MAG: response regulator [Ferruginibacter sp.]